MMENYRKGPLKKRPIIYVNIELDQPEDLSVKRKNYELNFCQKSENFCLDLSTNSVFDQIKSADLTRNSYQNESIFRSESPKSIVSESSYRELSSYRDLSSPTSTIINYENIHMRGLNQSQNFHYSTSPSGTGAAFQYPTSEMNYNSCSLTPPSSPISLPFSEPEDLSIRNSIPIPALQYQLQPHHHHHQQPQYCPVIAAAQPPLARTTTSHKRLPKHQKTKDLNRFKCDKCCKSYSTSTGLSKHQHFHCPSAECNQVKKDFSCQNCDKVYTTLGALKMHIRTHTLPCKCTICGKAFSRPWLLQGHIRTHTGEKPFSCQHCHRAFADRSNLRAHQQTHVQIKKYICDGCHKSFSRMSLLTKHIAGGCGCLTNIHSTLY